MEAISNPSDNDSTRIVAAVGTVTTLALITVVMRVYVRTTMVRSWGWDDALMVLTMTVSIVGFALTVVQANNGAGRHRGDVPPDVYMYGMKVNFVNQPIYLFAICFVKLAVGAALVRIASGSLTMYARIIYGIMGFMLFYTIACFFTIMFQCTDVRVLWNPAVPATCWSIPTIKALSYTNAALNIITDLLFSIAIPVPMLWNLNVNRRTRLTLMGCLGLGVFACAAAFVKVSFLPNYGKKGDFLWDSRNITIWTATELNMGIIAGSLPCLKPLFKRVLGSTYGRGSRNRAASNGANRRDGSKSWRAGFGGNRKETFGDTSSQTAFELGDSQLDSYVQSKGSVTTRIGSPIEGSDDQISGPSAPETRPFDHTIARTTVTTIRYSK